jgi:hypothetical protein
MKRKKKAREVCGVWMWIACGADFSDFSDFWIFFYLFFFYSLPLDVPLLAGFGFKVLSRSANELIIITIIFTVTQKKKMFGKKNKKREFCFATFLETKNQVEKSNKFIHTEKTRRASSTVMYILYSMYVYLCLE